MAKTTWTAGRVVAVILGSVGVAVVAYLVFVLVVAGMVVSMSSKAKPLTVAVDYRCKTPGDIGLTLTNSADKPVERFRYTLVVKQKGHSSNVSDILMQEHDLIVPANDRIHVCASVNPDWLDHDQFDVSAEIDAVTLAN